MPNKYFEWSTPGGIIFSIREDWLIKICVQAARAVPYETTGIFLGSYSKDLMVAQVHHLKSFVRVAGFNFAEFDHKLTNAYTDDLWERSNHNLYYIGDWHTHPGHNAEPSPRDDEAIQGNADDESSHTPEVVCMILGYKFRIEDIRVWLYRRNQERAEMLRKN